ncbi:hypothetical protein [Streptomyces sp. NPDC002176]|uniref:hypothetical protein n=1 Tax=Streptomyces sp. NPDC002176 TaxID=3364634 RepID=UPI00384CAE5F
MDAPEPSGGRLEGVLADRQDVSSMSSPARRRDTHQPCPWSAHRSDLVDQAADALLDRVADRTNGVDTLPGRIGQLPVEAALPGKDGTGVAAAHRDHDVGRLLGVEVESTDQVNAATIRLKDAGLATFEENDTSCCYALRDKVWVHGPGGEPWEVYVVKADAGTLGKSADPDATG